MLATVAEFVKAAQDSGILDADALAEHLEGIDQNTDPAAFAQHLIDEGRLTDFQARQLHAGQAKSLVLGPYVVLDMLGKGGMGCVYRAEHRTMRRVVALKVIAKTAIASPTAIMRFQREVQAAARLEHPNIVTAFDAGEAAGTHYLVMQLVDGPNLAQVVQERGLQPVGRAVDWILQAARGLAFAHDRGVIHRDIKPGNLLIDSRGTVKILDMGLAKLDAHDAGQDQLTGTGQIMGTLDYMAPEQAIDTRQADARSDIYALGVTLWYLLTGRLLFEADSVVKKIMAHQQQPPPSLAEARASADPRLDAIFQRMVAKQPADRFQSMREVIAALETLPQSAAPPGPPRVDSRRGPTALTTPRMAARRLPERSRNDVAKQDTARVTAGDVDTDADTTKAVGKPRESHIRRRPTLRVIAGGAAAAFVLVGLILFAFGSRRDTKPAAYGGERVGGPETQSASRTDPAPSMVASEPQSTPKATSVVLPSADKPRTAHSSAPPPPAITPFDIAQALEHQEAWANHLGIEVETTNSIGMKLVIIPPGTFTMGQAGGDPDEKPHLVTLTKAFFMGVHEVTNAQWKQVMGTTPSKWKEDDRPVEQVSWDDAVEFCRNLSALPRERESGLAYRLPTEAEWEYACRAGTTAKYFFGDEEFWLAGYGWFNGNSDRQTRSVGQRWPNPWGLTDVYGNVFEWCSVGYGDYGSAAVTDPQGPATHPHRVFRGGGHRNGAGGCRSAGRRRDARSRRDSDLGFRVAVSLSTPHEAGGE